MPLIDIRQPLPHTRLGLWSIDAADGPSPRERERHAVLQLLHAMTGEESLTISHEPSGKPFLNVNENANANPFNFHHLSISHTRGYAALLLSDAERVGVDIEYRSDRVERVASRFIRPDEQAPDTNAKLLLWSAKETVYKLFSEDRLQFFDMRLLGIGDQSLTIEHLRRNIVVEVNFELTDDYVLTYAVG